MAKLRREPPSYLASQYGPSTASSPSRSPSSSSSMNSWHRSSPSPGYINSEADSRSLSSPGSRTMSFARGSVNSMPEPVTMPYENQVISRPVMPAPSLQTPEYINYSNSHISSFNGAPEPRTNAERYWAYRAIVAETKLLEHKGMRKDELEEMREELKRQITADAAHKFHAEHASRLEKLAIGLISTIVLITLILLFRHHGSSEEKSSKRSFRPQFTIPILSPFTSIVEHEESKFGFRSTAVCLIILGLLAYAMFRHWLHRKPR